ncbi:MAG: D-alanyl-D-alanine carboxypeptidase [Marinobacter sp.]|nr:D-alanyl-D-alanine carboxypeptidase [Marinobacter sp.]
MAMTPLMRTLASLLAVMWLSLGHAWAQQPPLIPAPPQIAGSSFILMEQETGRIIMENNSHERLPPASLVKLMTAYIAERELHEGRIAMTDMVPISVRAWRTGGSRMFVQEGTQVSVEDLLRGVIIQSGNDASVALAEFIAGSESAFADIMNQQAQILGMQNSHFTNSTGLPDDAQYSTAYDMALLAQATIRDLPKTYPIYAERHFTYNNIRQPNRNNLLWRDPSVDGLKTGHTNAAGYCLVASAVRDDMRLIAVVMGTRSPEARAQEVQKMLNYGFRYFETQQLFNAGQQLLETRIWGGQQDQLNLGLAEAVTVLIPRGTRSSLETVVDVDTVIKAPIAQGQELGRVRVIQNGETLVDAPILALQSVEQGGLFKRLLDAIKLFFVNLFSR